jgi:ATP-dependent Clp protease adaptor protein ClpS
VILQLCVSAGVFSDAGAVESAGRSGTMAPAERPAMMTSQLRQESETERDTERDLEWRLAEASDSTRVLLHNDNVTPMNFVVAVLRGVFYLSASDAEAIMLDAHFNGVAYVMTLPHEEAKYRVGKAHGLARAAGYPLTLSLEPE